MTGFKALLLAGLIILGGLVLPSAAAAHTVITDQTQKVSITLHVDPDDRAIAGQPVSLFFDLQDQTLIQGVYTAHLEITDPSGQQTNVPVAISGRSTNANYTFPKPGAYDVELTVFSATSRYDFKTVGYVSPGFTFGTFNSPPVTGLEIGIIIGIVLLIGLLVLFVRTHPNARPWGK